MKKYAILSDIHGNLPALKAVVNDFSQRNLDVVINLGDSLSGPLWPSETIGFLIEQDWITIRGNHDREVCLTDPNQQGRSDAFAYRSISVSQREWLRSARTSVEVDEGIWAIHGSPKSDSEYLLEEIAGGRKSLRPLKNIERQLTGIAHSIVLCGHSHIPRCVRITSGQLVINPGSVGLQAYEELGESSYRVENGSPHARYAILSKDGRGWSVDFRLVEYDWLEATNKAKSEGREDWGIALLTGFSQTGAG